MCVSKPKPPKIDIPSPAAAPPPAAEGAEDVRIAGSATDARPSKGGRQKLKISRRA